MDLKRWLLLLVPAAIVLAIVLTFYQPSPPGQQGLTRDGITMLPSTVPVAPELQSRVLDILKDGAPARAVYTYAITDVSKKAPYLYVSVAGLPMGTEAMSLQDSVWLGLVTIVDVPGQPGSVEELQPSQPQAGPGGAAPGVGGAQNILPFRDTTTATYGVLGVHNCGFSLNGWKAVDLFPAENMVYSTNDGNVSYVCRDGTQVALRVGMNLYTHLVDRGQVVGDHYDQGQQIAPMVPGTYNQACGYADQQPGSYHVHFCFITDSGYSWYADGYALSAITGNWTKDNQSVAPLGTLTADWAAAGVDDMPGPAAGVNFWDSVVSGWSVIVNGGVNSLPEHQQMGIAERVLSNTAPALEIVYLVILSNINMTVIIWVVGIIFVLEMVRLIYSAYMWIKRAIPVIG